MSHVPYDFITKPLYQRADTSDLPQISEWPQLDCDRKEFRHLRTEQWRRDGRSLVTITSKVTPRNFGD